MRKKKKQISMEANRFKNVSELIKSFEEYSGFSIDPVSYTHLFSLYHHTFGKILSSMTNCHILRKVVILQSHLIRGEKEKQQLFYFL